MEETARCVAQGLTRPDHGFPTGAVGGIVIYDGELTSEEEGSVQLAVASQG